MHRDVLNFVTVTKGTDFVVTTSVDGHLKLWKKQEIGIEFVKHYRAHLQQVTGVSGCADGTLFASVSEDGTGKVFDVINFGEPDAIIKGSAQLADAQVERYDQYAKVRLYPLCLLLGSWERSGAGFARSVSAPEDLVLPLFTPKIASRSDRNSGTIRIYDGRGDGKPLSVVDKVHRAPVHLMTVS